MTLPVNIMPLWFSDMAMSIIIEDGRAVTGCQAVLRISFAANYSDAEVVESCVRISNYESEL